MIVSWFSWSCSRPRQYQSSLARNRDLAVVAPQHLNRAMHVSIAQLDFGSETVNEIAAGLVRRGSM